MIPWEKLAYGTAPDGKLIELRRRGHEFLIYAGGYDLMSSEDDVSSIALSTLGCAHLAEGKRAHILVGGLGMGYTLRAALNVVGKSSVVEIAELVSEVVAWNREWLGPLAGHPLDDSRVTLSLKDVGILIRKAKNKYDSILLDVDNGPDALAHKNNDGLYGRRGVEAAHRALKPGGALAVWSFNDDSLFTRRLERHGFAVATHRVSASRKGRGRYHQIWVARRSS